MRLTTVGTGNAAPSAVRVSAGHLVEADGTKLLMDCGNGVVHRIAALGIDWKTITHLAITHFHADHVMDVPALFFGWRYGMLPPRTAPVEIYGPPGIEELLARLGAVTDDDLRQLGFPVTVHTLPPGTGCDAGAFRLDTHKVPHTEESIAYSVRGGGRRVVYTGDTGPDAALASWAAGADVLLTECSLPASMAMPTHMTPESCAELAAAARPALLALTHLYPPVETEDIRGIIKRRFGGDVVLVTDGWFTDLEAR